MPRLIYIYLYYDTKVDIITFESENHFRQIEKLFHQYDYTHVYFFFTIPKESYASMIDQMLLKFKNAKIIEWDKNRELSKVMQCCCIEFSKTIHSHTIAESKVATSPFIYPFHNNMWKYLTIPWDKC